MQLEFQAMVTKTFKTRCRYLLFLTVIFIPGIWVPTYLLPMDTMFKSISTLYKVPPFKIFTLQKILGFKWFCHQSKKYLCIHIKQPGALFYIVGVLGDNGL